MYIMKLDTEQLITEVRLRPVLWDRKHKYYRNKMCRDAAWTEIMAELSPDYDSWSEKQKAEADRKIQQRWRTARDTYKKEKMYQNAQGNRKRVKYSLSEKLKFLDNDGTTAETDEIDDGSTNFTYEDVPADSREGTLKSPSRTSLNTPPPDPLTQESLLNSTVNEYGSSSIQQLEVPFLERLRASGSELEIEDLSFFQSLQPTLKTFTRQQKLMFRSRVLNIVMEMEEQASIKTEIIN